MWCRVQRCRGPNGERLKRAEWAAPVEGELSIHLGRENFVATLDRKDTGRELLVLYPIYDVRVQTFDEGLLVIGHSIVADAGPTREVRQAWYCVPIAQAAAGPQRLHPAGDLAPTGPTTLPPQ